jgi:putative tryptophan/tyrosine transport system substrate-binding protein
MQYGPIGCLVTLALTVLLAPLASDGQTAAKVPRIEFLALPNPAAAAAVLEPFRQRLHALGYVEGQTIVLEERWAEGTLERFPDLATELVQLQVDIIVAVGTPAAKAAQHATRTIPIVALMGDPVEMGLVASLARPGGNLTGVSGQSVDLGGKRLALLKEAVPQVSRVAVLWNAANPNKVLAWQETQSAAQALGVTLQSVEVRTPDDFERAFAALTRGRADALLTMTEGLTITHRRQIVDFTTQHRLPMLAEDRVFVEAGGLMSYGVKPGDLYGHLAVYVDKILKGAKPANLPVEQPMKFELVLNLKTAQAIGVIMPPTLLFQADEVIK